MNQNPLKGKRVIYVNFAPYTNTGRILDYLNLHADMVASFMFTYHQLTPHHDASTLTIYRHGRKLKTYPLYQTPTTANLALILLPLRSTVIFIQLLFYALLLKNKFGIFDIFLTVNAFTAWSGIILKKIPLVRTTLYWVWDYYPPVHRNTYVSLMRWIYWLFDKTATLKSDHIVFLNRNLELLRKSIGLLPGQRKYEVVGIGTDPVKNLPERSPQYPVLIFLGVVKDSQGLELVIRSAPLLRRIYGKIRIEVIGSGPALNYLKKSTANSPVPFCFHGYQKNERRVNRLLRKATIGIAPYVPEDDNVTYFTDPSKIKRYLSAGLPVITTDVFAFSETIRKDNAGVVIRYSPEEFVRAVTTITGSYEEYVRQAGKLSRQYDFRTYYSGLFRDLSEYSW